MRKHWNPMIGAAIALSLGVLPTAAGAAPSREDAAALRNVRERQSDASMLQNEARNRARAEAQRAAAATGQIAVEETERPKLDLPDTLKVQVNGFRITGQDVIPEPELQALLADKKGQLLTFKDLQEGADILTRYFRGKGYLVAHAYLPVQKINDGIVEYTVTVGTLDGFTINNHTSIRYIEKVALGWADQHITTVEEAKQGSPVLGKMYYAVMNAFGITGRKLVSAEIAYISRWTNEYGFDSDIILEACKRTMASLHQPNFKYTDSILSDWNKKQVHHLSDIAKLDAAHQERKKSSASAAANPASKNKFNNFTQRSYDYDELEQMLLTTNVH